MYLLPKIKSKQLVKSLGEVYEKQKMNAEVLGKRFLKK